MQHSIRNVCLTKITLAAIGAANATLIHAPAGQPTIQQGIDDVELSASCPAIDAGTFDVPELPAKDFGRNPRALDGDANGEALPDTDAFEFVP